MRIKQLYKFLARRTDAKFNEVVLKRLNQSLSNRFPISLSRLVKIADSEDKRKRILVTVGTVLNDERLTTIPKLRICALKVTAAARRRIVQAGGEILTFDQLVKIAPRGENTILLRGVRRRESYKHWGRAPGLPRSHSKPLVGKGDKRRVERTRKVI